MQTQDPCLEPRLETPVIFYDGVCGVCNRFIQRVIKLDKSGVYRFAPIQGETAERYLGKPTSNPEAWSISLIDETGRTDASTAVLLILRRVGWGFGLPTLGLLIPRPLRDFVYGLFAKYRYRLFGTVDSCAVPSAAVRARMLP
jgi:predicted DCC family thiol-disulfide oxidoreductase YuxK